MDEVLITLIKYIKKERKQVRCQCVIRDYLENKIDEAFAEVYFQEGIKFGLSYKKGRK